MIQSVNKTKVRKTMKTCFSKNKKSRTKKQKSYIPSSVINAHSTHGMSKKKKAHHRSISDSTNLHYIMNLKGLPPTSHSIFLSDITHSKIIKEKYKETSTMIKTSGNKKIHKKVIKKNIEMIITPRSFSKSMSSMNNLKRYSKPKPSHVIDNY